MTLGEIIARLDPAEHRIKVWALSHNTGGAGVYAECPCGWDGDLEGEGEGVFLIADLQRLHDDWVRNRLSSSPGSS